ncbi:MAG: helix-turn-helix domain-containing protein [Phycisphaerales bacterium]|nr:helix-turn-helix domain-containing protein [Phycisphaerales bacterium]
MTIVERFAGGRDSATKSLRIPLWSMTKPAEAGPRKPIGAGRRWGASARLAPRVCEAFAALGNSARLAILRLLLDGPATYRSLQKATGLAAGPLYHHVNQLRLAGLILPKQRDLYELTRGGRNLYMIALTIAPLTGDRRRRRCAT